MAATNGLHLGKGILILGCCAVSAALSFEALAQGTELPKVSVEAKKTQPKAKKKAAAPAKETPPAPEGETAAARDKAKSEEVYKTPASVSTAGRGDIETFGIVDTGDILRAMAGTSTRESLNAGVAVNIRGLEGSGRVNMMIDGVRQNFRFTTHEAQGFVYIDPSLLAGVDVARGAVSTKGGAGALVGTADLRTLDVEDILLPGKKVGVLNTITWGSNGVGWQEMLATAVTNGRLGIAGAISHREPDNYENGSGVTVPNTHQDLLSGLFKMNFALSSDQTLKLGAVFYDNDFFANSYFQNLRSDTYTLKYTYRPLSNPLIDFAFNAHANDVRMEYLKGASAVGRVMDDAGRGFDVTNTSRFRLGGVRVASTYGYEYFGDDFTAFNKINPNLSGGVNPSGESSISGVFSQTKFSYGIFDLITGLRYDTYSLQGRFDTDGRGPGTSFTEVDRSDGRLNPKVTLAAQVLPWLQPYVTYAEAFRAPTVQETFLGGSHPGGGVGFLPNPFLEPEVQTGWEFGFNVVKDGVLKRGDAFRFKATYFDMDVENYVTACGGPAGTSFCNVQGTSQVKGVEVQSKYDTGWFFGGLAYTWTDTNLPTQINGLGAHSYLPEHTAVLTAGLRMLEQRLTLGTRVSYFSESFVGNENVGGFYAAPFMPGYTLVDLFSTYKLNDRMELGVNVINLFDIDYTPALSTPIVGATCFGSNLPNCNDSGRGRTILFTAKTQF
jgi:hemoglobin/transferrin/lactoferrin receptor protein